MNQDLKGLMERKEREVHQVLPVHQGIQEIRVNQDTRALLAKMVSLEELDIKEREDHLVQEVLLVNQEVLDYRVIVDRRDQMDHLATEVIGVSLECQDFQVHQDRLV